MEPDSATQGTAADRARISWPELAEADRRLNAGLEIELIAASGYASRDGISAEDYIVRVLRSERIRLQELDRQAMDETMILQLMEKAWENGETLLDYVVREYRDGRGPRESINQHFLVQVIQVMERILEKTPEGGEQDEENTDHHG